MKIFLMKLLTFFLFVSIIGVICLIFIKPFNNWWFDNINFLKDGYYDKHGEDNPDIQG